jgi:hypothetical protein
VCLALGDLLRQTDQVEPATAELAEALILLEVATDDPSDPISADRSWTPSRCIGLLDYQS